MTKPEGRSGSQHQERICLPCKGAWSVAQIFNLPYRRIVFGKALDWSHTTACPNVSQSVTLRYKRVQLCATVVRSCSVGYPMRAGCGSEDLNAGRSGHVPYVAGSPFSARSLFGL